MPTLAEAQAHQAALADLTTLAIRDLLALWQSIDLSDLAQAAAQTRELVPDLMAAYGLAASTLAADWYEDLRTEAATVIGYTAVQTDPPEPDAIQAGLGWALAPLFETNRDETEALAEEYGVKVEPSPRPNPDAVLSRLSGKMQAAVAGADRRTIITNARRDPAAVRYARHASANACAFCAMLATRQAVYRSEQSAGRVVKAGRSRDLGEKFHDHCRCIAVPVWPGTELEEAPYVADWREAYFNATEALGGASDTSKILALMRDELGAK